MHSDATVSTPPWSHGLPLLDHYLKQKFNKNNNVLDPASVGELGVADKSTRISFPERICEKSSGFIINAVKKNDTLFKVHYSFHLHAFRLIQLYSFQKFKMHL